MSCCLQYTSSESMKKKMERDQDIGKCGKTFLVCKQGDGYRRCSL